MRFFIYPIAVFAMLLERRYQKTMASILAAYHQFRMQFGPGKAFYSDGEGALSNDIAKAVLKARGTELRILARGQRATTIEARNCILRHLLHVMEAKHTLCSPDYCMKPCLPPTRSPFIMRCLHATP
eukprot:5907648-Pyramimonas_sp.AAC.1